MNCVVCSGNSYRYLKLGITYVGPDFAGNESDIMLQVAGTEEQQMKDTMLFCVLSICTYPWSQLC